MIVVAIPKAQLWEVRTDPHGGTRQPTPQLGETNTPRPMDAAEKCLLYDGLNAGVTA